MKSSKLMIAAAFATFVLLSSAYAQTGSFQVTVPFAFTVGHQTLAAGDYTVTAHHQSLQLARTDGHGGAIVLTNATGGRSNDDPTPRLVFHRYGDRYFLSQAWIGGGREVFASTAELEYARTTKQEQAIVLASWRNKK